MQPRKKSGCGCGTIAGCLVVLLLMLVVGGGLTCYGFYKFRNFITDETPGVLPQVKVAETDTVTAKQKIAALKTAAEAGQSVTVRFDTREMNALLRRDDPEVKDRAAIGIEGDTVRVDFTLPMSDIPGFAGRWSNGTVGIKATCAAGILEVYLVDLNFSGRQAPDWFMKKMRTENLAEKLREDPETREVLDHINALEVIDGTVRVHTK